MLQVFVRDPRGVLRTLAVPRSGRVADLAAAVESRTGVPRGLTYLVCEGRVLDGDDAIAECLSADATVQLCGRVRGGAGRRRNFAARDSDGDDDASRPSVRPRSSQGASGSTVLAIEARTPSAPSAGALSSQPVFTLASPLADSSVAGAPPSPLVGGSSSSPPAPSSAGASPGVTDAETLPPAEDLHPSLRDLPESVLRAVRLVCRGGVWVYDTASAVCTCGDGGRPKRAQGRHARCCPRSSGFPAALAAEEGLVSRSSHSIVDADDADDAASPTATPSPLPAFTRPLSGDPVSDAEGGPPGAPSPHSGPEASSSSTASPPAPAWPPPPACVTFDAIARLRVPTVTRIPEAARAECASLLARVLRGASPSSAEGWLYLYAFPALVLGRCPRGGADVVRVLHRRVRMWRCGELEALFAEARTLSLRASVRRRRGRARRRYPVDDDDDGDRFRAGLGTPVADVRDLDDDTVARVLRLGRGGYIAKAMGALAAADVVAEEDGAAGTLQALQALHPVDPAPAIPAAPDVSAGRAVRVTAQAVARALRSFRKGAAPGPSGLTAQHLADLLVPGSGLDEALSAVVGRVLSGTVPGAARPHVFAARLVALRKKCGGVRPIACGETLRRLAAKVAMAAVKGRVADLLSVQGRQVGVGVPSGLDGMVAAFRRVGELMRADAARVQRSTPYVARGVLKLDLANAFNTASRGDLLAAVREHVPELFGYAVAAYGAESPLRFGDAVLSSAAGVQQGDPLGPLFFSLVLLEVWRDARVAAGGPPLESRLTACGFYLDDGAAAGSLADLALFFGAFRDAAAKRGLRVREDKCELVLPEGAVPPAELASLPRRSLADWELLGTPCGSRAAASAAAKAVFAKVARKTSAIASLPDPHVAFALLRLCGAFPSVVHLLRGLGPVVDFGPVDALTRAAVGRLLCAPLPDGVWDRVVLPLRMGGLGLESAADLAAVAHIAAQLDADIPAALVAPICGRALFAGADRSALRALDCPRLALFSGMRSFLESHLRTGRPGFRYRERRHDDGRQKVWSRDLAGERLKRVRAALSSAERARLCSAGSVGAARWLSGAPEAGPDDWLAPAEFVAAVRFRLGMPLLDAPRPCGFCHRAVADVRGDHAAVCLATGFRTAVHNALPGHGVRAGRDASPRGLRGDAPAARPGGDRGGAVEAGRLRDGVRGCQAPDVRGGAGCSEGRGCGGHASAPRGRGHAGRVGRGSRRVLR